MKKTYLISILILTLLFAVSSVSASENATDVSNALSDEIAVGNVEKISEDTAQALANDDSLKIQNAVADDLIGDNKSFEVIKSNSSLSASKVSGYSSFNTKFVAKLLIDGKQASGKKIVFSLNNKNYTRQTDAKGLATLNIQLPKGTYDVALTYAGDANTSSSKATSKITIKEAKKTHFVADEYLNFRQGSKSIFYVKLVDANSKPIKSQAVTFKVAGKTLKAKTTKYGYANFLSIRLK